MDIHVTFAALVILPVILFGLWNVLNLLLWRPRAVRRAFSQQGVPCLPSHFLLGNLREISSAVKSALAVPLPPGSHDLVPRLMPHLLHWRKIYGDLFVFWIGYRPALSIRNPDSVKEILNKSADFPKINLRPEVYDLLGESLVTLEGEKWTQHRRLVTPSFFIDKLKLMMPIMLDCIRNALDVWQSQVDTEGRKEIDVHEQFKILTADIISHTAFGSSYEEGKLVFTLQNEQQAIVAKLGRSIYIPGSRFLPTPGNFYWWNLNRKIVQTLEKIIISRRDDNVGNDLLGMLLSANKNKPGQSNLCLKMDDIIGECKTFFFAGHETTANLMTWTAMLLATNPEWQERVREEVLSVCGKQFLSYELLHNLKTVGMVLNEALRLYPPAAFMLRQTLKQTRLDNVMIPPNTMLFIPIIDLHHDTTLWGKDALEFNPQRFADGISKACMTSSAFLPFSMGPRNCVGQNFALLEARAILAMMLQRFRISLSPGYIHLPRAVLTVQPEKGMPIIFERL